MNSRQTAGLRKALLRGIAAAAGIVSVSAGADVTIEERIVMDGFGPMKLGAMEGTTTTAIAPDRARVDSQVQFKSRLLRAFGGGGGGTAQIIRLDTEQLIDIDIGQKQYTTTSFADFRNNVKSAIAEAGAPGDDSAATAPSGAPVNESQCEWSAARAEVSRSGATTRIAGFDTEQATITVSQTCTDRQTRASCDFVYSIDQWLSASMPGGQEAQAFWQAYARKIGAEEMASAVQMRGQQVFSRYKDGWGEALKSAGELEGYPLRSTFTMQVGGPSCADTAGAAASNEPGALPTAGNAAAQAGTQSAASAATSAAAQQAAEQAGGGVAGGIAGSAAGAFGGSLASGLLNRMRKREPEPAPAAAAAPATPGMIQMFRMSSETLAVREVSIPGERFDVPAGFRKVEP